jgi:flagellar biosynthesis/type III secretory pathway chaperone
VTINAVLETLEKLIEIHQELITLAKEKTPVLVGNQVDHLNSIMHKEHKLIKQVEELDQLRVKNTAENLLSRGYSPDPRVTISDLIKIIFNADQKEALSDVQQRLFSVMMELRKLNEVNQKLTEQSLAFINYSLDLFTQSPEQDAIYGNPRQQNSISARNGMFDTRA